jgi:hypothetical protein
LAAGSALSTWWVRLVLEGDGHRHVVLLLEDQLEAHGWSALQAELRCGAGSGSARPRVDP